MHRLIYNHILMGKRTVKPLPKKTATAKPASKTHTKNIAKTPKKTAPRAKPKPIKKVPSRSPKKAAPAKAVALKKAPKKKKQKAQSGPEGYTAAEYETYKTWKDKFNIFSNQALKDLLRKNLQSMSGNKEELVFKCADGATLGRIPRCPKCFGGRPKFDFQKGTYYCSGYRDDTDFHNCHSTFKLGEIKRETWEN